MIHRDEFRDLSDFDLALRSVEVSAEHTRLEAEHLTAHGFQLREVVGLPSVVWERNGQLHTTQAALTLIWSIPENGG